MKRKIMFQCGNEWFVVNELGHITQLDRFRRDQTDFTGKWTLHGASHHHWTRRPTTSPDEIQANPKLLEGGYVWDLDHGSTRRWGDRVTAAQYMD